MSILIKGIEMPKGCDTCPYCDRAWNKPKCKARSIQGRFMEQNFNLDRTRQKWCPLIEVPSDDVVDGNMYRLVLEEMQRLFDKVIKIREIVQ